MILKKLLTTEMPTISKSTPYWRALKVFSLLFLLSEIVLIFALLFKQVTLTEFWQISLFLLVLWPMMPLILRMKNDKTFLVITGSVSIVMVALLTAMKICDQYYVKSVFEAYLQGEDYQRKSDFLSKFASSNAIAYTQFLIDESDFLRQGVLEAKQIKEKSEHGHAEEICKLRNRITEHMSGLDERFITTGYSNRSSLVGFEAIRKKYDHLTNSLNDFEYFCDAYLALIGFTADSDDVAKMKENRVLLLDKDTDAKWLIKDEQDSTIENLKTRIDKDIHKFAKCPNLSDENFAANASGVAIKYKLVGTENLIAVKERKFKKGLQRRIELISMVQEIKSSGFDWRAIDIVFTRNLPSNDAEIASIVNTLSNVVSTETLLAQIPFIDDVTAEMERIEKEKEANPFYDIKLGLTGEDEDESGNNKTEK